MEEIFQNGIEAYYVRGEIIPLKDDIIYLKSGSVGVYSIDEDDKRFLFAYKRTEIFPYVKKKNLMSGREIEYRALSNVSVLKIKRQQFNVEAFKPEKIKQFVTELMMLMEYQIERIDNLEQGQVYKRLLERLVFFAQRLGVAHGDKIIIDTPMSHSDIASYIGSSRETVNRYMSRLQKEGLITLKKQTIVINSLESLKQMAEIPSSKQPKNKQTFVALAGLGLILLEAYLSFLPDVISK
jgi:CRP-like cAMP-binding protein